MLRILIDVDIEPQALERLKSIEDVDVRVANFAEDERPLQVELIRDVKVLFCTYPPTNFSEMTEVRWVQIASSGYTQLFPHRLPERGISATNARGCFDTPIAEWNIAMMVNLRRNAAQMFRNQQTKVWDRSAEFQRDIRGLTVGFWGYGGLARETSRLAKAMGMQVHVLVRDGVRPSHHVYRVQGTGDPDGIFPDHVFLKGDEQEFLKSLDFLVMAMPMTQQTVGIVGRAELAALKPTAFVLNPARGGLIQEAALVEALELGRIAGAAIDTHYQYPLPADHPLWSMPNVLLTPHIAGSSLSPMFRVRLWEIFLQNVERYRKNEPLLNSLTAAQLRGE